MSNSSKVVKINTNNQINISKIEQKIKGSNILIFDNTYAIALKYEKGIDEAPYLVYKSINVKSCKLAANNLSILIYQSGIAKNIAKILKIGEIIKPWMFNRVAEILSYAESKKENFNNILDRATFCANFIPKLNVELGKDLEKMLKYSNLLEKNRRNAISKLGLILAPIGIKINMKLHPNQYLIKIGNNIISEKYCTYNDITKIQTHLDNVIKEYASELLSRQSIYLLLDKLKEKNSEKYIENILEKVTVETIQLILTNLLKEQVPIKEIEKILETLSIHNNNDINIDFLLEKVRLVLSRTICETNLTKNRELLVITLSSELENKLISCITDNRQSLIFEESFAHKLDSNIKTEINRVIEKTSEIPVIMCSAPLRRAVSRFFQYKYPQITFMSYNELYSGCKVKGIGKISL